MYNFSIHERRFRSNSESITRANLDLQLIRQADAVKSIPREKLSSPLEIGETKPIENQAITSLLPRPCPWATLFLQMEFAILNTEL